MGLHSGRGKHTEMYVRHLKCLHANYWTTLVCHVVLCVRCGVFRVCAKGPSHEIGITRGHNNWVGVLITSLGESIYRNNLFCRRLGGKHKRYFCRQ